MSLLAASVALSAVALLAAAVLLFPIRIHFFFAYQKTFRGKLQIWKWPVWEYPAPEPSPPVSPEPAQPVTTQPVERASVSPQAQAQPETPASESASASPSPAEPVAEPLAKPSVASASPVDSAPTPGIEEKKGMATWEKMLWDASFERAIFFHAKRVGLRLLRIFRFRLPELHCVFGERDPFRTAQWAGVASALLPIIAGEKRQWDLEPRFGEEILECQGRAMLSLNLGRILWALVVALFAFPFWTTYQAYRRAKRPDFVQSLPSWRQWLIRHLEESASEEKKY